jgi:Trk-type K+ transport system membrane component
MILGGIAYALTFDWVAANILPVGAYGKLRLPELLGLPEWVCYAGLVVMTISVFALVNKAEKKA